MPYLEPLKARCPDDLRAALPHVLGFTPAESVVLVPLTNGVPAARVDVPHDAAGREAMRESLRRAVLPQTDTAHAPSALVIAVSDEEEVAAAAATAAARALEPQVRVDATWCFGTERWHDVRSGRTGGWDAARLHRSATLYAAQSVVAGRRLPPTSRDNLEPIFTTDRVVPSQAADARPYRRAGARWAASRVRRFLGDGLALSDHDAYRMLNALRRGRSRRAVLACLDSSTATQHQALWADLARRAPRDLLGPVALLHGRSSWAGGDGAAAWLALDACGTWRSHPEARALERALVSGRR